MLTERQSYDRKFHILFQIRLVLPDKNSSEAVEQSRVLSLTGPHLQKRQKPKDTRTGSRAGIKVGRYSGEAELACGKTKSPRSMESNFPIPAQNLHH